MAVSGIKLKTLPAITVASAGTAVPIYSTNLMVYEVIIVALDSGTHYVGDSTVTASNGMPLTQDGDCTLIPPAKGADQFNIANIYVNSDTNDSEFRVMAWVRE